MHDPEPLTMQELQLALRIVSRPQTGLGADEAHPVAVLQQRLADHVNAEQLEVFTRENMPPGTGEARQE
jgi:hypothetical protein